MNGYLAVAVAAVFVWLGMVLAISFLEAPLKFRAPGITIQLGLGIGRLVFRALNICEVALAAFALAAASFHFVEQPMLRFRARFGSAPRHFGSRDKEPEDMLARSQTHTGTRAAGHDGSKARALAHVDGWPIHLADAADCIGTLTQAMARDLAPDLRVNALAPGIIDTEIQTGLFADRAALEATSAGIPMARLGQPVEVAEAAAWLLFDAPYITGEVIRIAGGRK